MASSQVEITSSNQFCCVLRDRNSRDLCSRDSNARQFSFPKNLKELERDHLHATTGISISFHDQNSDDQNQNNPDPINNRNESVRYTNNNQNNGHGSLTVCSRQERILDRWAARQAQEMVSTIESQSQDCELLPSSAESSPSSSPLSSSALQSQNSRSQNLGASSLVQIWEARLHKNETTLNRSNSLTTQSNHSRTNSPSPTFLEESLRRSDVFDTFVDWESSPAQSVYSSIHSRSSDAGDRERNRIADIIRRLTSDSNNHLNDQGDGNDDDSLSKERNRHSLVSDQAEHRCLPKVNTPKIRGRQAFNDLLLQMERDRHKELDWLLDRQAVSKFPQRGRIQSMLRLRFMHRGMVIQEQLRPQSTRATSYDTKRSQEGPTIMHLRERFSSVIKKGTAGDAGTQRICPVPMKTVNTGENVGNSSMHNHHNQDIHHHKTSTTEQHITSPVESSSAQTSKASEVVHREIGTSSDAICQKASLDVEQQLCTPLAESCVSQTSKASEVDHGETSGSSDVTWQETSLDVEHQFAPPTENSVIHTRKVHEEAGACSDVSMQGTSLETEQQSAPIVKKSVSHAQEIHHEDISASSEVTWQGATMNDWEDNEMEEEDDDVHQDYEQTNYDWISNIAHPRSYWEDRRQAWYQEMFSTTTDSNEIRKLLERKTVSTFLASDFREKMDQLMELRVQRHVGQEYEFLDEGSQDRMAQLMLSYFERHSHAQVSQEEHGRVDEGQGEEEEEEEFSEHVESQTGCHLEAPDSFYQSSSSSYSQSPLMSWNYNNHHGVAEQASTTPPHPPPTSQACNQKRHRSSIEMELIYDLRGHMEQLHREMSELRRSIQSCVEMQMKMQSSYKKEVHPVPGERKTSLDKVASRRNCCVCHEMQVDTFLYRCGHMCTCLKCAHELQMSNGKCPICCAPIQDVVRASMDF